MLTKYNQPVRSFQLIPPEIGCKSIFARLTIHQINSLYRHDARDQWSAKHTTAIPHKSHTPPIRGSPPLTSLHLTETSTPRLETGKVFVDAFRVMNSTREYPTRYGSAHVTVSRHLFYCSWLNRLFIGSHQWISKEFQRLCWTRCYMVGRTRWTAPSMDSIESGCLLQWRDLWSGGQQFRRPKKIKAMRLIPKHKNTSIWASQVLETRPALRSPKTATACRCQCFKNTEVEEWRLRIKVNPKDQAEMSNPSQFDELSFQISASTDDSSKLISELYGHRKHKLQRTFLSA